MKILVLNKRLLLLLCCLLLLAGWLLPSTAHAEMLDKPSLSKGDEREQKLAQFEQITEALYQDMQDINLSDAPKQMELLIDSLKGLSFQGLTSVDGIHALAEVIMDVRGTLAEVDVNPETWASSSAKLRLAVNSLVHHDKALWMQYYKVLADDLSGMGKSRAEGKRTLLRQHFLSLQSHYDIVRPAIIISREPSEVNKFDSWLSYMDRLSKDNSVDDASLSRSLEQGETVLKELFGRKGSDPVFMPIAGYGNPWSWSILLGGWILLALAYAGMRKYRADQNVVPVHTSTERADRYRF